METARFLLMVCCAEWLIIFRTWVAPRVLFGMAIALGVRMAGYMYLPHFAGAGILIYALMAAGVWHLRGMLFRRTGMSRRMYQTPDTGVPWLVIIAQQPKLALMLELGIVAAFIFFLHASPVVEPLTTKLRPEVQAWMYQNALTIANLYAMAGFAGLLLWDLVHFTQRMPARDEMRQGIKFNTVRPKSHRTPKLPSVKDMIDDLQRENP